MAKIMDPILPILSILGYGSVILRSFGGPGRYRCMRLSINWGSFERELQGSVAGFGVDVR